MKKVALTVTIPSEKRRSALLTRSRILRSVANSLYANPVTQSSGSQLTVPISTKRTLHSCHTVIGHHSWAVYRSRIDRSSSKYVLIDRLDSSDWISHKNLTRLEKEQSIHVAAKPNRHTTRNNVMCGRQKKEKVDNECVCLCVSVLAMQKIWNFFSIEISNIHQYTWRNLGHLELTIWLFG